MTAVWLIPCATVVRMAQVNINYFWPLSVSVTKCSSRFHWCRAARSTHSFGVVMAAADMAKIDQRSAQYARLRWYVVTVRPFASLGLVGTLRAGSAPDSNAVTGLPIRGLRRRPAGNRTRSRSEVHQLVFEHACFASDLRFNSTQDRWMRCLPARQSPPCAGLSTGMAVADNCCIVQVVAA